MTGLIRMLRQREILKITGWSRSTLRRRISKGNFPRPRMDSKRMPQWFETDVADYQQQIRAAAGLSDLSKTAEIAAAADGLEANAA